MKQYLLILGREPEFSVAELAAAAEQQGCSMVFEHIAERYALVRGLLTESFLGRLAGIVKCAEVIGTYAAEPEALKHALRACIPQTSHRVAFGISYYGSRRPRFLDGIGMAVKRELKERGHVRYVVSREPILSSVVVAKNHLLPPDGYEFVVVLSDENRVHVARTVWVQDFEAWSARDYGRPSRDARVGMLPPKLARMMANMARLPEIGSLLDPFCGSGTVLMEAALLGYRVLAGSDIDARGISRTKANWRWFRERYPQHAGAEPALYTADIRELPRMLAGQTFGAVVTEPYLGPPLTGKEPAAKLEQLSRELAAMYRVSLGAIASLLIPRGRAVMVWPVLKHGKQDFYIPLDIASECGFKVVDSLPPGVPQHWRTSRGSLRYERTDARVARELFVLQR